MGEKYIEAHSFCFLDWSIRARSVDTLAQHWIQAHTCY